jgi:sarcosine oxidase subunit beta
VSEPTRDFDAVIIGAGVIGCAIGFELARRGWRTLNVDKGPGAGYGSTSASSAVIRFSYSTPTGCAAAWDGMHYWSNWGDYLGAERADGTDVDELGMARLVQCGMVLLIADEHGHHTRVRPIWDELGIPYEAWDADELRDHIPAFDLGRFGPPRRLDEPEFWQEAHGEHRGALYSPHAGYVDDPQLAAHNLQRASELHGGEFRFRAEVTGIETDGRVTGVRFADGSVVSAPVVVNAAGPHSAHVNRIADVDMRIGTEAIRHETYHTSGPPDFDFTERGFAVADDDNGIYFRPQPGNHILLGTTDPACDPTTPVDPDAELGEVSAEGWETNMLRINKRMPSLGVPLPHDKRGVVACYDKSDDWIPIYDRTDLDGFYVAIGTSGNQFKNAGVAGHMMAELIEAVERGHDHDADPLHVTARWTGLDLDLSTFARNRSIHATSSMSVHG